MKYKVGDRINLLEDPDQWTENVPALYERDGFLEIKSIVQCCSKRNNCSAPDVGCTFTGYKFVGDIARKSGTCGNQIDRHSSLLKGRTKPSIDKPRKYRLGYLHDKIIYRPDGSVECVITNVT